MPTWFPTFERLAGRRIELPSFWPLRTTKQQSRSLARLLAVALEQNLPLLPLLEAFHADERGTQRRRVGRLIQGLKAGRTLPDAVEDNPGVLSEAETLALRFDAQTGTRTEALRRVLADWDMPSTRERRRARRTVGYLAVMLPIGLVVFSFLFLKVVPVFFKILQEFGTPPPSALVLTNEAAHVGARYWWLVPLLLLALFWISYSTRAGRLVRHSLLGRAFQSLRELQAALVLDQLAVAAQAGRPLSGALSTLARYHYAQPVRQQLLYVRNELEQGADVWQAMSTVGLLSPADVRLLATAERLGNRAWVLHQLAGTKRHGTQWRLSRLSELVLPAAVIVLGVFVLLVALAIFQPLVQLIDNLA